MRKHRMWSEEEIQYCRDHCSEYSYQEMADAITKLFGKPTTFGHIKGLYARNHLGNGRDCRFLKGQPAHNKGKTWDEYMPKEAQAKAKCGQFKKGNKPYNWSPIGNISVRTDTRGNKYHFIKVQDKHGCKNYMLYSRYVYEKAHNVKLKDDEHILHLDGNSLNDDIDNLMVVSMGEKCILNGVYYCIDDAELRKSIIYMARINNKLSEFNSEEEG